MYGSNNEIFSYTQLQLLQEGKHDAVIAIVTDQSTVPLVNTICNVYYNTVVGKACKNTMACHMYRTAISVV